MKKSAVLLSLVLILGAPLASCGSPLTEEQAKEIVAPLIEKSYEINDIFFGDGLPHEEVQEDGDDVQYDVKSAVYLPVVSEKYDSIESIKEAAREVYTESYLNTVFSHAFEGMTDGAGNVYEYARYISSLVTGFSVRQGLEEENILSGYVYDVSTLKITGGGKGYVYFTVAATRDGEDVGECPLSIKDEGNGWRLDSPTY